MLEIKVSTLVEGVVRQELVSQGRESEALYFNFDTRLGYYNQGDSYHSSCGVHLLYHCNPGITYINVFSAVTDSPFDKLRDVKAWTHEVSHDSCWRDIGLFSNILFSLAKEINDQLAKDGKEKVAPANMTQHIFLRDRLFSWVPVKVEKAPYEDQRQLPGYQKVVTVLM